MKKLLSLVLAIAMVLSMTTAFAENATEKGTIIYGSSTEIGGDFAPGAWWTNNATDKMIRDMTNDYAVTVTDQGGAYVVNPTVCAGYDSVVNPDGSKTFTVKINEGLTYNNGEAITAADFVWPMVFACSPVATEVGAKLTGYLTYVGGQDFYDGKAAAVSGIRLIDEYTYSVTIVADKGCAVDADGLSTTCLALGVEKGIDLIMDLDGVEAVFVDGDGSLHVTSDFPELTTN